MEEYKISIIVPVYNAKQYLHKCVDSLLGQTYQNTEILLVDDGSTDGSGQYCKELAAADPRIRVLHKINGGLISAWKHGVSACSGEYLCFVDSDDWVDSVMLSEMAVHLTGSPWEIIASDYVIERENGSSEYRYQQLQPGEYAGERLKSEVIPQLLGREVRRVAMSRCMKLIGKELVVKNCRYSDERIRMGEDVTIMLPALIDCERLVIMDHKAYYHYLFVTDSMVHKYDAGMYENCRLLHQIIARVLEDKFDGASLPEMLQGADREHVFMLLLVLKNEVRGMKSEYLDRILQIFREEETARILAAAPVEIHQTDNRLLYFVAKHPNRLTVRFLRLVMRMYDQKKQGI